MATRVTTWLLLAPLAMLTSACGSNSGVVASSNGSIVGSMAPNLTLTAADGTQWTLHENRAPVAIVAFVSSPGCDCCWVDPRLANLAQRYADQPISVVQVSEIIGPCPGAGACRQTARIDQLKMKSLCDTQQIAWKAFEQPDADTAFLLDEDGRIVAQGSLSHMDFLLETAEAMGKQIQTQYQPYGD